MYLLVNIIVDAGDVWLINPKTDLKLEVHSMQPKSPAIFQARQLAKILDCKVFIDGIIDDGRKATSVVPRFCEALGYSESIYYGR